MFEIDLDKLIFRLLCLYAALLPFELVLEILFGIETILKPYRVVSFAIIGIYGIKQIKLGSISLSKADLKTDMPLYLLFAYGLFISFVKMITSEFSQGHFYNHLFQLSIYLTLFVVVKNTPLSKAQIREVFKYLGIGTIINAIYMLSVSGVVGGSVRQGGFLDNPNYFSLSLVVLAIFVILFFKDFRRIPQILLVLLLPFLSSAFSIAGSRTGLFVLIIAGLVLVLLQSLRQKIFTFGFIAFIGVVYLSIDSNILNDSIGNSRVVKRAEQKEFNEDPRPYIWEGILEISEETYYLGMGLGQFEAHFSEFYRDVHHPFIMKVVIYSYHLSPHSDYFDVLITYGIIGLVFFLTFFVLNFQRLARDFLKANTSENQIYKLQIAILIIVALFGLTNSNFISPLWWLLLTLSTKHL